MRVFSWLKNRWVIGGILLVVTAAVVMLTVQASRPLAQLNNGGANFASFQSYCAGVGGQFVLGRGCYDGQPNTGIFMESKGWWYRDYIIAFCQQGPCTNDTCSHGASCTSGECPISACPAGSTPSYAGDGGYYTGLVCANTYYGQQCGNTAFRPGYINGCTMFAAYDSSGTYQPTGPNCGVGNQCTVDADCPVNTETCRVNKCVNGTCQVQTKPAGDYCGTLPANPDHCEWKMCDINGMCTLSERTDCVCARPNGQAFNQKVLASTLDMSLGKPTLILATAGSCTNNDTTSCNFPDSCGKVEYTNTWSGPGCCDGGGSKTMILTADPGQNYATLNFSDACDGAGTGTKQVPVCPCNSSQSSAASSNSSASSGGSNSSRSSVSSRSSASSGGSNSSASGNSNSSRSSTSSRVSSQSSRASSVSSQSRSSSRSSRNSNSSASSRSSASSNNSGSSQSSGGSSRSSRNSSDGSGSSRSSGGSNSSRSGSSLSGSSRSSRNSSDGSGSSRSSGGSNSSRSGSSLSGSSRSSANSSDGSGSSRSSGGSNSSRSGSSRSSGGSSRSSTNSSDGSGSSRSASSRSSSRASSASSIGVCRGDECARGGDLFCSNMGGTCETLSDLPCIQCIINDSSSSIRSSRRSSRSSIGVDGGGIAGDDGGDDGGDGGDDSPDIFYCGDGIVSASEECDDSNNEGGDGCTAQCRIEASIGYCTGRECTEGGSDVCGAFGLSCEGTSALPCIQCVDTNGNPEDPSCNGNACNTGGSNICGEFGMSCMEDGENPCFVCEASYASSSAAAIAVMNCSGRECSDGGDSVCNAFGLNCAVSGDLPCISCVNAEQTVVQPSCAVDGCLAGGSDVCGAQGLGCKASDSGACFECTNKEGTMVAVASPFICGNGRVEPGEQCDNGSLNSDNMNALCRTNCRLAGCGDGILDTPLELCDDGNLRNGDGCSQICTLERSAPNQTLPGQIIELPFFPGNGSSFSGDTSGNGSISGVAPVTPLPASTPDTGPAAIAVMAAGAAAGYSYMKRRRL